MFNLRALEDNSQHVDSCIAAGMNSVTVKHKIT